MKTFAFVSMLIFAACVFLHKDGHPTFLTDAKKDYVLTTLERADQEVVLVIEGMEQFVADPENPISRANALTKAFTQLAATTNEVRVTSAFYYELEPEDTSDFANEVRRKTENLRSRQDALNDATERLVQVLAYRGDSLDLEHESFESLREVLRGLSDLPASMPCDHRTCFWCLARNAWLNRNQLSGFNAN